VNRRTWIGTGIAATLLASAGAIYERPLQDDDAAILGALAPVMLGSALPNGEASVQMVIDGFHTAVAGLSPSVQDEVAQLFTLLRVAPLRMIATGVMRPWRNASPDEIERFLTSWRYSGIAKLRSGYDALHQLTIAAWYGNPKSWPRTGYPGPPTVKV
jgi:hypothetical protein